MKLTLNVCALIVGLLHVVPSSADVLPYSQNFERITPSENVIPNTLSSDGWLVGANVFDANGAFIYNYFAFPAPNGGPAFSGVVTGQGGDRQGRRQLTVYSDYNNTDHGNSNRRIEANVFRDIGVITAADVGKQLLFSFDVKQGNIAAPTTATAFLKVLDLPTFGLNGISSVNTHNVGTGWSSSTLSLTIQSGWVGDLVQIGFTNTAGGYVSSGMVYDNLKFTFKGAKDISPIGKTDGGITSVPEPGSLSMLALGSLAFASRRRR